MGGNEP